MGQIFVRVQMHYGPSQPNYCEGPDPGTLTGLTSMVDARSVNAYREKHVFDFFFFQPHNEHIKVKNMTIYQSP